MRLMEWCGMTVGRALGSVVLTVALLVSTTVGVTAASLPWGATGTMQFGTEAMTVGLSLGGGADDLSLTENANYILAPWRLTPVSGHIADLGAGGIGTVTGVPSSVSWQSDAGVTQGDVYLMQLTTGNYAKFVITAFSADAQGPSGTLLYAVSGASAPTQAAGPVAAIQATASGVTLTWGTVSGSVTGYDVFRGTAPGGEAGSPINGAPSSGTAYTDTSVSPGQTYYYTVTAIMADGSQSQASTEVSATAVAAAPKPTPTQPTQPTGAQVVVAMTIGGNRATVDGVAETLDVPPLTIGGRTLVPLRFLGDAIGAAIKYNDTTRQITFSTATHTVVLTIDQPTATVDGQAVALDVPPTLVNNRTLVPVRFVSENLGGKVTYDPATQGIQVTFTGSAPMPQPQPTQPPLRGGQATGGSCAPVTVGASVARIAGQGRILFDYNGGAGTLVTVDPTTGAVTGQTTYPILRSARYDPATGTTVGFPYLADQFPRLSPDGTHASLGLKIVATDGSAQFLQGHGAVFDWTSAEWSPDGRYLAYQGAGGSYFRGQVYVMDTTTGKDCLAVPAAGADYVKWLPGGGLVYSTDNGLYRVSADLSQYAQLPVQTGQILDGSAGKGPDGAGDFDLSPDGTRVTWASPDSQGTPQIWISNLAGTGAVQLTHDQGGDVTPRFSPDGAKIAYVRKTGSFPGELWTIKVDGTGAAAAKTATGQVMLGVLSIEQWSPGGNVDTWPSK